MHIKRVVIQGFKTYKNTTIIDAFSPHHNVVVGRNGSGKSNFFSAIRFVLSDAYTHMTREERQSLIHEGSGTVMSAYVEIIFDNIDRRFPLDRGEIVIRRTIGLKKDDYSLDHKSSTRSEIMNLLESAGFSKSNPYYIVPQGRITSLTNAKDSERLQLLKEVAGAKIFEVKLKESLKEMNSCTKRREKIDEMLTFIERRLEDLNLESYDLKDFEKLNNLKKMLEYNIFDKELTKLNEAIEEIDVNHNNYIEHTNGLIQSLSTRETQVKQLNEEFVKMTSTKKMLEIEKSETDTDIDELLSRIATVNMKLSELKHAASQDDQVEADKQTLKEIRDLINEREGELMSFQPLIEDLKMKENQLSKKLANMRARQRAILGKQGRFDQFNSKSERDSWLKQEIKSLNKSLDMKKVEVNSIAESQTETEGKLKEIETEIDKHDAKLSSQIDQQNSVVKDIELLKDKYTSLLDERKTLWREDAKLHSGFSNFETELNTSRQKVNETMDRAMAHGLESVKRIAKNLKLEGVYGSLGELITVSEKYKTAVEVIGGNSLFHVVVDTDATASIIMDELVREKSGRVTFMPLNRINPQTPTYPTTNDCVPLIKKISYDEYLDPVVKQIFGKAAVVMNLERGADIAREYKLTTITLDGDRCDKKGVLTGGFRDFNKSRLDSLNEYKKWKKECEVLEQKLEENKKLIEAKDQEINKTNEQLTLKRKQFEDLNNEKETTRDALQACAITRNSLSEEISSDIQMIESLNASIESIQDQVKEHTLELSKSFEKKLSKEEQDQLTELSIQIPKSEEELDETSNALIEKEFDYARSSSEVTDKLKPRAEQLTKKLQNIEVSSSGNQAWHSVETDLVSLKEHLAELNAKSEELQEKLDSTAKELKEKENLLEKANDMQRSILSKLGNFTKNSEKNMTKKSIMSSRRDQINKKIRELGVLPESAFTDFVNESSEALLKKLNRTNEDLKKYSHVNKKALEQSITFTKQRDELVQRSEELDEGKAAIEDLISVLEERKDNAIINTFKQVSEGFAEIFEKLVPAGSGRLIIQRKTDSKDGQTTDGDEADDDAMDVDDQSVDNTDLVQSSSSPRSSLPHDSNSVLDNYLGVSIAVSFNSKHDEQQRIEQLSGGQKTLCAIALILAIQKCDPAPFYLFDEIDAALDTQYRSSVAKLINELSRQDKQFICTTFRSEMLDVADKFFGVLFNNKVSSVTEIEKGDALAFIEGQK